MLAEGAHLRYDVIRIIRPLLSSVWSKSFIMGRLRNSHKNEVAFSQGGALSHALFILLILILYDRFYDQDASYNIILDGVHVPLKFSDFIDDMMLFSEDWYAAQRAQDIASDWAHHIRMLFILGANKSAELISQQLDS